MLEYSVFDNILDPTFVIDSDGKIVYCNETGAAFCQLSIRRVIGKALLSDFIQFSEPGLLPFTTNSPGRSAPSPLIETPYSLVKNEKTGKVQLSVRPVGPQNWIFFLHDVSLEETLAAKYRSELLQKEEYARNLEKLVEARTAELRSVNQTLNAILDSLGQGFFTFNPQGGCGDVFTKACENILEGSPKGRKAWEVLGVPENERDQFKKWMDTAFKELLPFDDLKTLGPGLFKHSLGRHVVLDYFPIRREKNEISDIVVVATDKTTEHQAQMALESERQYASMIVKYLKNREQFLQFLASVKSGIKILHGILALGLSRDTMLESFRVLHTLEGEAGTFSLRDLRHWSRECQHILEPFKVSGKIPPAALRKYGESLVRLDTQFEKFLVDNAGIFSVPEGEVDRMVEVPIANVLSFSKELKAGPDQLRDQYIDLFLKVPIESRFKYFDGLVQSVAERLGKKVKPLVVEGGGVRIFPEPYQAFFSNLVHAFRNAVDHGLEEPMEREWAGKDPAGLIRVKVSARNNGLHITVSDDGKGIDPLIIREKLKAKYPDRDFSSQSDAEVIQNVALPGFSSRDSVGEFSGRGVGLDALREVVLGLGGTLRVTSKLGVETAIEIFVPELGLKADLRRSA